MALAKPPYVVKVRGRWYWQPRGRMALTGPPCELGADQTGAFAKGWSIYNAGLHDLKQPSGPQTHTVSWGAAEWRKSDHYSLLASGKPKKPGSIKAQETGLKALETIHGKHDLRGFTRRAALGFYKKLREDGHESSAAGTMRTTRMLFNFFVDQGYRSDNPFLKSRLHVPSSTYVPWGQERVRAFFDAAVENECRRVGTFLLSVYEAAQNPSDVLVWRWDQIRDGGVYHGRGKTGQQAFTPLSAWLLSELDKLPKEAVQLFVNPATKRPYTYRYIAGDVRRIARLAGIPDECQMRYLRHEAAQEAVDGGAEKGDVQSLLAHASPGTQDYYADRRDATRAQDARKLWKDE